MSVPRRGTKRWTPHGTLSHCGPFSPSSDTPQKIKSTVLVRCLPIITIFTAWAAVISVLNDQGYEIYIETTLLTTMGTVLGFVISYTTSSSFDKYNQGRKHWSRIIFAIRNLARIIWFHIPDQKHGEKEASDKVKAERLIEKKTVINLLGAFAVSVKHYLRGEGDCICYQDLYHSVKFLPAYHKIAGIPKHPHTRPTISSSDAPYATNLRKRAGYKKVPQQGRVEQDLRPAMNPPPFDFFGLVPFCFLIPMFNRLGRFFTRIFNFWGRSDKLNTGMQEIEPPRNIPLELSLYLSSYIESVQQRGVCDSGTINRLAAALETLLDCYAGLECILSSPVHFSFAAHLWSVTSIFCFVLPIMIWPQFEWVTIPATAVCTFLFFGFLVAGKELEDPFGYDKNDLNLDYITNTIIRGELKEMTATDLPFPEVSTWAFAEGNDHLLADHRGHQQIPPSQWVKRGPAGILQALGTHPLMFSGVETQSPSFIGSQPTFYAPPSGAEKERSVNDQHRDSGNFSDDP